MRRRTDDAGAVMVEFALIMPLLIMLLMGVVEFGRAYNIQISIQAAAREGARAMALGQNGVTAALNAAPSAGLSASDVSTGATCPASPAPADMATVTVTKTIQLGIPFFKIADKNLTATARMRCGA